MKGEISLEKDEKQNVNGEVQQNGFIDTNEKNVIKELFEWLKVIVVSFIIALIITSMVKPTVVIGESMNDTLHNKDLLLVNRLAYKGEKEPQYKDIVIFKTKLENDKVLIKRVIGEPGDKIKIENGQVYRNGQLLKESYIGGQDTIGMIDTTVPEGKVFVMGDNRNNSLDSRFEEVGFVDEDDIIGKIMFRIYPFEKIKE